MLPNLSRLRPVAPTGAPYVVKTLSDIEKLEKWTPGMLYDALPNELTDHHETAAERLGVVEVYVARAANDPNDASRTSRHALLLLTRSGLMQTSEGTSLATALANRAVWLAYRTKRGRLTCSNEFDFSQATLQKVVGDERGATLRRLVSGGSLYVFFTEEDDARPDKTDLEYLYFGAYKKRVLPDGSYIFELDCAKNGYNLPNRVDPDEVDAANKKLIDLATALGNTEAQNSMIARWMERSCADA